MKENVQWQDERVLEERRKIRSRSYSLLVWALILSLLVQELMGAPFAQYAVEFWMLIGCGVYQMIAHVRRGIDVWQDQPHSRSRTLLTVLAAAVAAALLLMAFRRGEDWTELVVFLVMYVPVFVLTRRGMAFLSRKRQDLLDRELEDDDE